MRKLRMLAACEMSGRVRDAFAARGWEAWSADLLPCERPGWTEIGWPSEEVQGTARHYQGDVRDLFSLEHPVNRERIFQSRTPFLWDLFIAFPPCTHLTLGGARYWKEKDIYRGGDGRMQQGAAFFREMTRAPAPYVAVENPRGVLSQGRHPDDSRQPHPDFYREPDQVVQPWMFGDPLVKNTCLWLKGLPQLHATHAVEDFPELKRVATGGGSYRVDKRRTGKANNGHEDSEGRARRAVLRSMTPPGLAAAMAAQWGSYVEEVSNAARY